MKKLYKLIIFLAMFQFGVLIINATGVFPTGSTLYSDVDVQELSEQSSPIDIFTYFFTLPDLPGLSASYSQLTFGAIVFIFMVIGAVMARATHSWTPVIVVILGTTFIPMITRSMTFFGRMFYNWDSVTLVYMFLAFGFGILMLVFATILETPTHGDA